MREIVDVPKNRNIRARSEGLAGAKGWKSYLCIYD